MGGIAGEEIDIRRGKLVFARRAVGHRREEGRVGDFVIKLEALFHRLENLGQSHGIANGYRDIFESSQVQGNQGRKGQLPQGINRLFYPYFLGKREGSPQARLFHIQALPPPRHLPAGRKTLPAELKVQVGKLNALQDIRDIPPAIFVVDAVENDMLKVQLFLGQHKPNHTVSHSQRRVICLINSLEHPAGLRVAWGCVHSNEILSSLPRFNYTSCSMGYKSNRLSGHLRQNLPLPPGICAPRGLPSVTDPRFGRKRPGFTTEGSPWRAHVSEPLTKTSRAGYDFGHERTPADQNFPP